MGKIHFGDTFGSRDIFHGEIEIFPSCAFRDMVEKYGNVIFKVKEKFGRGENITVSGSGNGTCRLDRNGKYSGSCQCDSIRGCRGSILDVGGGIFRNVNGICGECAWHEVQDKEKRKICRWTYVLYRERNEMQMAGGNICGILHTGGIRHGKHDTVKFCIGGIRKFWYITENKRNDIGCTCGRNNIWGNRQDFQINGKACAVHGGNIHDCCIDSNRREFQRDTECI